LIGMKATTGPVRWLLATTFVNQLGAFVRVFLVLFLVHRGAGADFAGLALAAYGAGTVLGALVGGSLADRLGRRATIVGALAAAGALTAALAPLATVHPALLAAVALAGVATQASRPASAALLADLVPEERLVMAVSASRLALNAGAVLGPLLATGLMTVSWDLLFWADGLTSVACALLARRFLPADRATGPAAIAAAEPGGGYRALLRDRRFALYLFAMLASALIYMQYFTVLPLQLQAGVYTAVLVLSAALVIACELLVTSVVQRWRPVAAGTLGAALLAAGLAAYGLSTAVWLVLAATLVGVAGQMIAGPTMFAHPQRVAPLAARGRYTGAAHSMFGLGTALGPLLGVLAWSALGEGVWTLCGALGALAALATFAALPGDAR
jgi:MFS family permease